MKSDQELINALYSELEQKNKDIEELQSQLEEALEVNQELQEPRIDSFHDL